MDNPETLVEMAGASTDIFFFSNLSYIAFPVRI